MCELALIWSVGHLRSPNAHRILAILVHPYANFPPKPHVSLPLATAWLITLLSLTVHLTFRSRYRRIRRQPPPAIDPVPDVSRWRVQATRRIILSSSPAMAICSTLCYVLPGSFPYECWVWRMSFGGTLFCLIGVSYVVFWMMMLVWRCVRSRRGGNGGGGGTGLKLVEESASSDSSLEEGTETEVFAVDSLDSRSSSGVLGTE